MNTLKDSSPNGSDFTHGEKKRDITLKTSACAISLGSSILKELSGVSINGNVDVESDQLVAAALTSELRL